MADLEKFEKAYREVREQIEDLKKEVDESRVDQSLVDPEEYIATVSRLLELREKAYALKRENEGKLGRLWEDIKKHAIKSGETHPDYQFATNLQQDYYGAITADNLVLEINDITGELGLPFGVLAHLRQIAEENKDAVESSATMEMLNQLWMKIDFSHEFRDMYLSGEKLLSNAREFSADEMNDHAKIYAILIRYKIRCYDGKYPPYSVFKIFLNELLAGIQKEIPEDKRNPDIVEIEKSINQALKQKSLKPFVDSKGFL